MTKKEEGRLRSAYELAMERLRAEDRDRGVESRPLSPEQKERIAELRRDARAKIAEIEILLARERQSAGGDPAKIAEIEEHHRIDRGRIESSLESAIARVRRGEDS